jgi:hypothetical protein
MEIINLIYIDNLLPFQTLMILGYIDPGTGSIIIQALVAAVVGVGIAVKLFWHRILKFLGIRKPIESNESDKAKNNK